MASAADAEAATAGPRKRAREEAAPTAPLPDELSLPHAAIMRIVKSKLPDGMMVGSDTKKAFSKACSLFILYLSTMCAPRPRCHHGTRTSAPLLAQHAGVNQAD